MPSNLSDIPDVSTLSGMDYPLPLGGDPGWVAPAPDTPAATPAMSDRLQKARTLVLSYGWNSMAYQILNPGISLWFSRDGDAVVGYVESHGYRIVAGAPVCAPQRLTDVTTRFEADASRAGYQVCYFGAQDRMIMTLDTHRPLAGLLLGAQPVWQPANWAARLQRKVSLRAQLARARNKQVSVTAWTGSQATNHPILRRCLTEWLQNRRMPPLHFLVEPDTLGRLEDRKVLVATRMNQVIGFLIASPVPRRNGWLIEQIIRTRTAPNGTTELLLDTAMRSLAAAGAAYVTLGLSALSRRAGITQTPQTAGVRLLLALTRSYGQRFYNFEGLDAYRAKFLPEWWEPVYALSRERHISLQTMYAIVGAFSSTSPLWFLGRAVFWALSQEFQHLRKPVGVGQNAA